MSAHVTFSEAQKIKNFAWEKKILRPDSGAITVRTSPADAFNLRQLNVEWHEKSGTLWTDMAYDGRPSYNPPMLLDFVAWQNTIESTFRGREDDLRYLVLASRFPGVFSLGGDLSHFADRIRSRDRDALVAYGKTCTGILHRNFYALGMPMLTIGLAEGDALGGGLESLLSFNVVVAERGAKFGMPETLFGLFPGMGAHCLLTRLVGAAKANDMILSGRLYTAEEMYDCGLVHILVEPGQGRAAVHDYIRQSSRKQPGHVAAYRAARQVMPLSLAELDSIVEIWADASLGLREQDLKVMERLVGAQDRLRVAASRA
jgi:DSF synthase